MKADQNWRKRGAKGYHGGQTAKYQIEDIGVHGGGQNWHYDQHAQPAMVLRRDPVLLELETEDDKGDARRMVVSLESREDLVILIAKLQKRLEYWDEPPPAKP
jgi:hypothetical protein